MKSTDFQVDKKLHNPKLNYGAFFVSSPRIQQAFTIAFMKKLILLFLAVVSTFSAWAQLSDKLAYVKIRPTHSMHTSLGELAGLDYVKNARSIVWQPTARRMAVQGRTIQSGADRIYVVEYIGNGDSVLTALKSLPFVESAVLNPECKVMLVPNDPFSDSTLALNQMHSPLVLHNFYKAWEVETGDTNIAIGVIDSGINPEHEDIKDNLYNNWNDPVDGVNNDGNTYQGMEITDDFNGWDVSNWDNDPTGGGKPHGLSVSGMSSATPNNGVGHTGSGYNCRVFPFKVTYDSHPDNIIHGWHGFLMAAQMDFIKVINLSWGAVDSNYSASDIQLYQQMIDFAVLDMDKVVVSAAGNSGKDEQYFPAGLNNVLSVTGVKPDSVLDSRSTFHESVDISAAMYSHKVLRGNGYVYDWGTSLSAPIVSGAAGLVRSKFPHWSAVQVMEQLRVSGAVIDTLPGNEAYVGKMGRLLDPYRALTDTSFKAFGMTQIGLLDFNGTYNPAGDVLNLFVEVSNYLAPTENLEVELKISGDPRVSYSDNFISFGALQKGEVVDNSLHPVQLNVEASRDTLVLDLEIIVSDGGLERVESRTLVLYPTLPAIVGLALEPLDKSEFYNPDGDTLEMGLTITNTSVASENLVATLEVLTPTDVVFLDSIINFGVVQNSDTLIGVPVEIAIPQGEDTLNVLIRITYSDASYNRIETHQLRFLPALEPTTPEIVGLSLVPLDYSGFYGPAGDTLELDLSLTNNLAETDDLKVYAKVLNPSGVSLIDSILSYGQVATLDTVLSIGDPIKMAIPAGDETLDVLVELRYEDGVYTHIDTLSLTLMPDEITSVSLEEVNTSLYQIFPNPFNDRLNVKVATNEDYSITMLDMAGNIVFQRNFSAGQDARLEGMDLVEGIYLMQVQSPSGSHVEKVIRR